MEQTYTERGFYNKGTDQSLPLHNHSCSSFEQLITLLNLPASITGQAGPSSAKRGSMIRIQIISIIVIGGYGYWLWQFIGLGLALVFVALVWKLVLKLKRYLAEVEELKWFNEMKEIIPVWSRYPGDPTVKERKTYAEMMLKKAKNDFMVEVVDYIFNDYKTWGETFVGFEFRVCNDVILRNRLRHEFLSTRWKEKDIKTSRALYEERILGQNLNFDFEADKKGWFENAIGMLRQWLRRA